jgi:succinate dehydrogenase / fumarate reductase membrane anchor subunit
MSLRTPLGRVLNHGAAHDGVSHWWIERITALALVPLSVWLIIALLRLPLADYAGVSAWIGAGLNPVLLGLFVLLACWHSHLGVQVVVEDYVHAAAVKTATLLLSSAVHLLLTAAGLYAVLRIALKGVA